MKKNLLFILFSTLWLAFPDLSFGQAPNLGTASSFALFTANGALTNVGASVVTGDIGTNVGAFSGFESATVVGQTRLPGSTEANQAAIDVSAAYTELTSVGCGTLISPTLGNGQVLTAGVYCQTTAAASSLTGTLTLSGPGVFIIKLNSALTTAAGSTINLINGACLENVYFQVNGAVDLGAGSTFRGTILANGAISLLAGASLEGRALSTAGAISLSNNSVINATPVLFVSIPTTGSCNPATNQYSISGILSLTNASAGTATLTDGASTTLITINAGDSSVPFNLTGLNSGTGSHTVTVSYACQTASVTYASPASCTVAIASLGGTIYSDANTDGVFNGGDSPIAGVVVSLLNGSNSAIASTTTNASGVYNFTGLTPGLPYSVSATTPVGYSATIPGATGPITLTSGENNTGVNVAYTLLPPTLTVGIQVDRSIAQPGDVLSYTIVVTNSGSSPAANVVVRDSTTIGLTYVANSATVPIGTTFTQGTPISSWSIVSLGVGQSISLTFQAIADSSGILYNTVRVQGEIATACTSIPVKLCPGDEYILTVPAGRASYSWYKDGVLIAGQTSNTLVVSEAGSYSLGTVGAGGCPDFSCCPFIVEADPVPIYQVAAIAATCLGSSPQTNGQLVLSNFNPANTYQYSLGATFDPMASLSGAAQVIPANGIIATTLASPVTAQTYTVRVRNSSGCFTDVTVTVIPTVCDCPEVICVPVVIRQNKILSNRN